MPLTLNFFHMGMSNPDVALRFLGIYQAQIRGLLQAGVNAAFTMDRPDANADAIVCGTSPGDLARVAVETVKPIILYVPPNDQWFDAPLLQSHARRILFAYGPVTSEATALAYRHLGLNYHTLPFAADEKLMRPLGLPRQYDLVFLGGLNHRRGYRPFLEPLLKAIDPSRLLCIGGGWQKYGIPAQSIAYGPLVNTLYNLAKVGINLHAPEQTRGPAIQLDVNNRLFDLAMAGCVQVTDNPEGVGTFFSDHEIFAEETPERWVGRVLECLTTSESDLAPMREATRTRALAEHTWTHRGKLFHSWIKRHM